MKFGKSFWLFIGGSAVGFIIGLSFLNFIEVFILPHPPKIAGVKVPSKSYEIDFSKRYNLTVDFRYSTATYTYNHCLIKGFTQSKTKSMSSSRYDYFDSWLVVELSDSRIVYLPPRNIIMIEESKI